MTWEDILKFKEYPESLRRKILDIDVLFEFSDDDRNYVFSMRDMAFDGWLSNTIQTLAEMGNMLDGPIVKEINEAFKILRNLVPEKVMEVR